MIVTTAGRTENRMFKTAELIALELGCPYIKREKKSIQHLWEEYESDVLVIGKNRYEWHKRNSQEPLFFHPNTASFRVKRWLNGEHDPFITVTNLKSGMSLLDCTLGLASDSIMASLVVGEYGNVVGIEGNRIFAYIVEKGLKNWSTDNHYLTEAMNRIKVTKGNYHFILPLLPENSFDVIYFDPMFESRIVESNGIAALRDVAVYDDLTIETIEHAKRVAKNRVVLKDHWQSDRFEKFGFQVQKRKTAKFHFGFILT
ncbi:class I SAM-dependent methyltransferase [Sutcliffiella rhizosphaerae]|uniref:Ribosomal RNA small subunit methyltransferase J n=1 Tax=Sutcliffiella rhizosphaerae TaxID=2880967 RepID=A0ABM8YPV3_9BACI|nr:class I SAM-dependent methyltransferase [Sutcliffiella rhizosphaerae]CAG9622009.1 Ribosomal RNA small subunit methyltransferase J [Sutcliffiella rhizosphaerae]